MLTSRAAALRLLWSAIRRLPDGEETLRAAVVAINDRDGTNAWVVGSKDYSSTRRLSDIQLYQLAERFRGAAGLPAPSRRPRGPKGGKPRRPAAEPGVVTHLATPGELDYLDYLFRLLQWSPETRQRFIDRQTRRHPIATHQGCCAVVEPLERMLRARGWTVVERDRVKTWSAPSAKEN